MVQQQQKAAAMQQKVDNEIKQVYARDKAFELKIREKQEKARDNKKKERGKGKNGQKKDESNGIDVRSGTIDIKI